MRIIAGTVGGRRLSVPSLGTRPTSDRVREAVFAMLESRIDIDDVGVLDLYAGSGGLALEALSRGAAHAHCVEGDRRAGSVITANAISLGMSSQVTVSVANVETFLVGPSHTPYSLVFCDPPYDVDAATVDGHLAALTGSGWLVDGAVVVVERSQRSEPCTWPENMTEMVTRRFGDTRIDIGVYDEPIIGDERAL